MGEIFPVERPATALPFTGERMTSVAHGQIEYEHLHRYCFARMFCRGKQVVDIAAGEGYGSALLAQVASRVVGIEMAADAVEHAVAAYSHPGLCFLRGDARYVPLQDDVADVVVSFETLEHLYDHELFLAEIRRILRPEGVLVISSPNSEIYSPVGGEVNPFHVRELTSDEFRKTLSAIFPRVQVYSQRALIGSVIAMDAASSGVVTFERRSEGYVDAAPGLSRAPYAIAVASARRLDKPCQTVYIDLTRSAHLLTSRYGDTDRALDERAAALERETAELRAALQEREAALAVASRRAEDGEAQAAKALAELEAQRALVVRQRIAAQLAAAEAVHDEVAQLRQALAAARQEAGERRSERERIERQLAELSDALNDAERRVAESGVAAEAAQQEVAVLGDKLNAREQAAERELAEAMAHIAVLSDQLAQAADERAGRAALDEARAGGATVAAAEAEIARLREALAAAERETRRQAAEIEEAAETRIAQLTARLAERTRAAAESEAALQRIEALFAGPAEGPAESGAVGGLAGRALRRLRQRRVGAAIRAGDRASRGGDSKAAVRYYRRAVARSPGLAAIWVQLGHALKEQGDRAGAEAAYRRSLAIDPAVADTHLQLGHLLKLLERWSDAAQAYNRAFHLDPAQPHVAREIDELYARLVEQGDRARDAGDWLAAARHYEAALACRPGDAAIWVQLGHARKEQGDYAGAEAAYRHALSENGVAADTHLQLGHALKLQRRLGDAADAYARAAQLDPSRHDASDELAALWPTLIEHGDRAAAAQHWAAAVWHYRRAAERAPAAAEIWIRLGQALHHQGEAAAAEAACGRALALDPRDAETQVRLAELLWLRGRRESAIDAYAAALRLDPELTAASDGLAALLRGAAPLPVVPNGAAVPTTIGGRRDVIWLGVIDWHFRIQRPQHLATHLADRGARVFYVSLGFEPADDKAGFRIVEAPHDGVFEVKLRIAGSDAENLYRGLSPAAVGELQGALDALIAALGIRVPVVVVDHPAWHDVACGVSGATVVYDCLDLATGFSNVAASLAAAETAMLAHSDLVIAASQPLVDHVSQYRPSVLIRNAADVQFFAEGFSDRVAGTRPVVGYFGAIAEWFNIDWIEYAAAARPDWRFRLIGRTDGCDTGRAAKLRNVAFLGERPYRELPQFLRDIDVAIIPFKMIDLIRCTNPVKLYEYMAAGKPVVAAPMPEVVAATELAYIAADERAFVDRIAQALAEDSLDLRLQRLAWARQHTWQNRAGQFDEAIEASLPLVSVIVLTYNNWQYTSACLAALREFSDYPRLEIIVVDNASTDQTRDRLREVQSRDPQIRVILNDTNLGFAAGNNVGLRAAHGEFLILLNNDTVVTRGWVRDLIRPMQRDPRIGLAGPLTNNIGNEQKVKPGYTEPRDMHLWARRFARARLRQTLEVPNLAFFCVAFRRAMLEEVGLLDEAYGIGFYEDDDYCRRARQANWRLAIVDDVFVHHHLSASFAPRGPEANGELMARNKAIFEERWGPWEPHRYRDEPGFG